MIACIRDVDLMTSLSVSLVIVLGFSVMIILAVSFVTIIAVSLVIVSGGVYKLLVMNNAGWSMNVLSL